MQTEQLVADEQTIVAEPITEVVTDKVIINTDDDIKKKRRDYQREYYHRQRNNKKKFDKKAYMKKYHAAKKAEKTKPKKASPAPSSNGALMNVIMAYQTMYNNTNSGEVKAKLNQALSAIVVEMA